MGQAPPESPPAGQAGDAKMHAHSPDEKFIPLSEAAKMAGVTPEHLNLLARQGKVKAQKIGRNWFTTKLWIDQHFKPDEAASKSPDLEFRKIEMQERIELAKINAEIQKRQIQKEEAVELARTQTSQSQSAQEDFVVRKLGAQNKNEQIFSQREEIFDLIGETLQKFNSEKQELAEIFASELNAIKNSRKLEQGERRALIFAFENLQTQVRDDIERRISELAAQINERLSEMTSGPAVAGHSSALEQIEKASAEQMEQLRQEKEMMAELFVAQLDEIKKQLDEKQKKQDLMKKRLENEQEAEKRKREAVNKKLLQEISKELGAALSKNLSSAHSQPEVEEREVIDQIKHSFSRKTTLFPLEPKFSKSKVPYKGEIVSEKRSTFVTAFIGQGDKVISREESVLKERKLQITDWRRESIDPSGTHFLAKHGQFYPSGLNYQPTPNRSSVLKNRSYQLRRVAFAGALVALIVLGAPSAYAKYGSSIAQSIASIGTKTWFVAEVGDRLGEQIVLSLAEIPTHFSETLPQAPTSPANLASGLRESGQFLLSGLDSQIKSRVSDLESRSLTLADTTSRVFSRNSILGGVDAGHALLIGLQDRIVQNTSLMESGLSTFIAKARIKQLILNPVTAWLDQPLVERGGALSLFERTATELRSQLGAVFDQAFHSYKETFSRVAGSFMRGPDTGQEQDGMESTNSQPPVIASKPQTDETALPKETASAPPQTAQRSESSNQPSPQRDTQVTPPPRPAAEPSSGAGPRGEPGPKGEPAESIDQNTLILAIKDYIDQRLDSFSGQVAGANTQSPVVVHHIGTPQATARDGAGTAGGVKYLSSQEATVDNQLIIGTPSIGTTTIAGSTITSDTLTVSTLTSTSGSTLDSLIITNGITANSATTTDSLYVGGLTQLTGATSSSTALVLGGDTNIFRSGANTLNIGSSTTTLSSLVANTNTLVVNANNNRVGIGTASPAEALDVSGNLVISGSGQFNNVTTTDTLHVGGKLDVAGSATSTIASSLVVNTSDFVVNTNEGRIGIGTATPTSTLSVLGSTIFNGTLRVGGATTLDGSVSVSGALSAQSAAVSAGLTAGSATTTDSLSVGGLLSVATSTPWGQLSVEGQGTGPSLVISDTSNNTDFIVDSSGRIGIGGLASANSSYPLKIQTSGTSAFMQLVHTNTGTTDATDGLVLGIDSNSDAYLTNRETGSLRFEVGGAERLRLPDGGGIAIEAARKIWLDGVAATGNTYIHESTADTIQLVTGGTAGITLNSSQDATIAGDLTVSGTGPHAIGGAALGYARASLRGNFTGDGSSGFNRALGLFVDGTITGANGDTGYLAGQYWGNSITTQGNTETITTVAQGYFTEPAITVGTGDTVTNSATIYVASAATEATNNYALWVDAGNTRLDGNLEVQGTGPHAIGGSAANHTRLALQGSFTSGGASTIAQGTEFSGTITAANGDTLHAVGTRFTNKITTQGNSETIGLVAQALIDEPNITVGTGDTITNAATAYIAGAPTEATNNYALFVDAGTSRFDGDVNVTGADARVRFGTTNLADLHFTDSGNRFIVEDVGVAERFAIDISSGHIGIISGQRFYLDGTAMTGDTYITESGVNQVDLVVGGSIHTRFVNGDIQLAVPGKKLYLDGGGDTYIYEPTTNQVGVVAGGTDVHRTSATNFFPTSDNTITLGGSSNRWVAVYAVNGTIQTSDVNAKREILDSELGLGFITSLKPSRYAYNEDEAGTVRYGLIAQDVLESLDGKPFAGLQLGGDGLYGLNYSSFVAPIIQAIKELNTNITSRLDYSNAPTTTPSIVIDSTGNIGIGTETPAYKLHVAGDIAATSFVNTSTKQAKTDIAYLSQTDEQKILNQLDNINIARYRYLSDANDTNAHSNVSNTGRLRLGLIAEEAPQEILSVDGNGVDIYKLSTYTLTGLKALKQDVQLRLTKLEEKGLELALNDKGYVEIKAIETEKVKIAGSKTVGKGIIRQGDTAITIPNKYVGRNAKVFVSFRDDLSGRSWYISEVTEQKDFTVRLTSNLAYDVEFDWWIIETDDEGQDVFYSSQPEQVIETQPANVSVQAEEEEAAENTETTSTTTEPVLETSTDKTPTSTEESI